MDEPEQALPNAPPEEPPGFSDPKPLPAAPLSVDEAEAAYDPHQDPSTFVQPLEDGGVRVLDASYAPSRLPKGFPTPDEAGVRTIDQFREYMTELEAAQEEAAR